MPSYDYIICGAGAAGLSLALRLSGVPDLKLLIIDKDDKTQNDRTWCYWSNKPEYFDAIVTKKWSQIIFASSKSQKTIDIDPYSYAMIRGIDFYEHCFKIINASNNIDFVRANIDGITEEADQVTIKVKDQNYTAKKIFKSYPKANLDFSKHQFVLQHFMGWEIITESPHFEADIATFMDFSIDQDGETRFMYVLPSSKSEALVELAIFSNTIPDISFYESILKEYIEGTLGIRNFRIKEKEQGSIPMTNYPFAKHDTERIIHIGTAAGAVKPSSGFAFQRIQEHSDAILECINKGRHPKEAQGIFKRRFKLYDATLLNAILTNKTSGETVFSDLFKHIPVSLIFKFLNEKTSIAEELRVFTGPPTLPFLRGFIEEV